MKLLTICVSENMQFNGRSLALDSHFVAALSFGMKTACTPRRSLCKVQSVAFSELASGCFSCQRHYKLLRPPACQFSLGDVNGKQSTSDSGDIISSCKPSVQDPRSILHTSDPVIGSKGSILPPIRHLLQTMRGQACGRGQTSQLHCSPLHGINELHDCVSNPSVSRMLKLSSKACYPVLTRKKPVLPTGLDAVEWVDNESVETSFVLERLHMAGYCMIREFQHALSKRSESPRTSGPGIRPLHAPPLQLPAPRWRRHSLRVSKNQGPLDPN